MSNDEDLFKLFSPTYHFDEPIKSNDSDWCIVAEQSILVEEEIFWNVIKKWTLEPELVIPPLKKCDIVEQTQSDAAATERITRDLISKRKSKDPILREQVEYYPGSENCPARVTYTPVVTDAKQLPFYYPKVRAYSFVFDCVQDDNAEAQHGSEAAIRLEIQPFRPSETGISDDKMIYALCEVFHKLYKWCIHTSLGYEKRAKHDVLVPKEMYHTTYAQIKAKYAETIISQWTEKTDATKFVFEDIAIASYLICLWELERQRTGQSRLQSFIDLGCGNGLLTHLLVSEGYPGKGIDLAKRKIWDKLSPDYLIGKSSYK
ncbi:tRNA methyltransferase 44 [Umbelopsis nana]